MRVVALSGGYTRDDACERLAKNHGMIASFSRALAEGLKRSMSDAEFDEELGEAVDEIYQASTRQGLTDGCRSVSLLRVGLALRVAGLARARAQGHSLSS